MKKNNWAGLIIALIISHAAGFIGGLATSSGLREWYAMLTLPSFQPPGWLFGPVWLTLYTLIGISLFLAYSSAKKKNRKMVVGLFFAHWVLNTLWSILFFGLHQPLWALLDIILLLTIIIALLFYYYRLNRASGWLLVPYLLWVGFAAILNYYIIMLN